MVKVTRNLILAYSVMDDDPVMMEILMRQLEDAHIDLLMALDK